MTAADTKIADRLAKYEKLELGKTKVLMIEDDPFISQIVITKLSKSGCIPYSTTDGSEAIILAEQFMPDVIILDLMLPGVSGEDILKILKSKENLKNIPVIVFTNRSSPVDMDRIISLGAAKYMLKVSTDLNVLVQSIKELAPRQS